MGGGGTVGNTTTNTYPHPSNFARPRFSLSSSFSPISSSSSSSSSSSTSSQAPPARLITSAYRRPHRDHKDDVGNQRSSGSFANSIFRSLPSQIEVENAIAALQSFMQGISSLSSAFNHLQPLLSHHDPNTLQSPGFQRLYDAFQLLQAVPSVKRMVVSIASDRAFWDAVLKNSEVQEFQRSLHQVEECRAEGSNGDEQEPDLVGMILTWVLDNMKLKVVGLIEILKSVISKSFETPRKKNTNPNPGSKYQFEEMICSTVLLSTITLMIVLVNRTYGA